MSTPRPKEFSRFTLEEALSLLEIETLGEWIPEGQPVAPSAFHIERMRRLRVFDTNLSEMPKQLLIEAVFEEVLQTYATLKVFKIVPLRGVEANGFADYLIAPNRTLPQTPLLCVAEAKKDNFERGLAQCLAELHVCAQINRESGHTVRLYGIISNGQAWQFCRRETDGSVAVTSLYALTDLERLLGILGSIFADCAEHSL
jgi:hypothetical protein